MKVERWICDFCLSGIERESDLLVLFLGTTFRNLKTTPPSELHFQAHFCSWACVSLWGLARARD